MACFLALFSPETQARFSKSDQSVTGFRTRHRGMAGKVKVGDRLLCYLTRLSRWIGILEVVGESYEDSSPIFADSDDPFVVRFAIKPEVWFAPDLGIPIHNAEVWDYLSFTKECAHDSQRWTGFLRGSLNRFSAEDAEILLSLLTKQAVEKNTYKLSQKDQKELDRPTIHGPSGDIVVSVPESAQEYGQEHSQDDNRGTRHSIKIQAMIAKMGVTMGFKIWLPANDRAAVRREWDYAENEILKKLPLSYDEVALATVERIDVLWIKGRSIERAFEVEHTTAIYSGILRMADLLALLPNMDIRLHIVAPIERRAKVFDEIRRPVFRLLNGTRDLANSCTFLSYESIEEISALPHLDTSKAELLEKFEEEAE